MSLRRQLLLGTAAAAASCLGLSARADAPHAIHYPQPWDTDLMARYVLELFSLALGEAASRFELQPLARPDMAQSRNLVQLGRGSGELQLVWTMSDAARERVSRPIRIPLDRGLFGWRLSLIRRTDLARWQALSDEAGLRRMVAGQGHDWPDTAVLRANGLAVVTATRYDSLFEMLRHGRFDHLPRSVLEIQAEATSFPDLVIAPGWLIQYPAALYAFVSTAEPEFERRLAQALEAAVRSGLAARLFHRHFDPVLRSLGLAERRVLRLRNPLLSAATPLQRAELWERA